MENININELAIQARRDYYKKWRAANKDKVAQHNRNFWAKKALAAINAQQSGESNNDGHKD